MERQGISKVSIICFTFLYHSEHFLFHFGFFLILSGQTSPFNLLQQQDRVHHRLIKTAYNRSIILTGNQRQFRYCI